MRKDTCFYDGRCGLCRRSMVALTRMDWLGCLTFVDQSKLPDSALPVPRDLALKGMPMVTASGKTLVGYPAVRRALLRTPLGCLPACLLYLPVLSHVGRIAYAHIAANRGRDACSLDAPSV